MRRTFQGPPDNIDSWEKELICVVAIPARNEEQRIFRCLAALAGQKGVDVTRVGVLLLVNNSTDGTARIAESLRPTLPFTLRVLALHLPVTMRNAGGARRCAMDIGFRWLTQSFSGRLLLTTDADSRVDEDWLQQNIRTMEGGADAVAGLVSYGLDNESKSVQRYKRLECTYEKLIAQIESYVDPLAHDPWPCHRTESGASLAIRADTYYQIGGLPRVAVGEDRALCAAVAEHGLKLRHSLDVRVQTSARLNGRAAGGAANCLLERTRNEQAECDPHFVNAFLTARRARYRRLLRQFHQNGQLDSRTLCSLFRIPANAAEHLSEMPCFQSVWSEIQRTSPQLSCRPMLLRQLPFEIVRARFLVQLLRVRESFSSCIPIDPAGTGPFFAEGLLSRSGASLE